MRHGCWTCGCLAWIAGAMSAVAALVPTELTCEYRVDPLGIDTAQPRLSWVLAPSSPGARDQSQTAFQVLVTTNRQRLTAGQGDLWDSGKINSDRSVHVTYEGKTLKSHQECFWKVRVWDQDGKPSPWSKPARWSMGLLAASDWKAKWIGLDEREETNLLTGTHWIWFPEGHPAASAPVATRYFRRQVVLPADPPLKLAQCRFTADNEFTLFVNGQPVGAGNNFHTASDWEVLPLLRAGANTLAVMAKNVGPNDNPAGLAGLLRLTFTTGEPLAISTDGSWRSATQAPPGWEQPDFDDRTWSAAQVLGPVGMAPWGQVRGEEQRRLPARMLRREFLLTNKLARATAYICGLGLSELYLNGRKVSDHVLSPTLTEYTKRACYVTHEVTTHLKPGPNAIGVILGNGRFYAPRGGNPTETRTYGFPKLLLHLRLEYRNGSIQEIVSDESWRLTADGPIRANNEYDGEEYDARRELEGWSQSGFNDSAWQPARRVAAPGGALVAQMQEPIRVVETLHPRTVSNPQPGVYVFDLGQNLVGWCRLVVSGPRGAQVTLRHAETLRADGSLYLDNLRSAKVTDLYVLNGKGPEVYEPRFTYHGFRYVEMKGFPGVPTVSNLVGCVVHDDLPSAGEFTCSNPLLNRIYQNVRWGVRGNYRSIPTDCPQRDERQGWLGDRSEESRGESYLYRTLTLHRKWLQDMADAQQDTGSVPDVAPAYWPIYSDDVTWPSSTVIIPGALYDQFGDLEVLERHYPSMKKWVSYMQGFLQEDLISKDTYGDWCVPPEEQRLIHSQDPVRKTAGPVLATSYFYHDLMLMARYARLLGYAEDVRQHEALAARLKTAFNRRFLDSKAGRYDNGSPTSCVLPLAFGLVPSDSRSRLFDRLVLKLEAENRGHLGTGLIGGQWLMRVLSDRGRPDLAYTLATQKDYPSWGYMIEKGATTIWELWNGDTADPAMNSGNHVMLVGDLIIWLHEYLAGIKPDPENPGFKRIIMRPQLVGDLQFVRASHHSLYGWIRSEWRRDGEAFHWNLSIPPNTTATLYIPATKGEDVTERGRPAAKAPGLDLERLERGCAVFTADSGDYQLTSRP